MVIANLDFLMEAPRPVMPHIIQIPCLFVEDASPVQDAELKELFDSAEDGAIVSFGPFSGFVMPSRNTIECNTMAVIAKVASNIIFLCFRKP